MDVTELSALVGEVERRDAVTVAHTWRVALYTQALAEALGVLGAAAILWGRVQAIVQSRLKMLVAYSTVGQLGYLLLAFPLARHASAWAGVVLFAGVAIVVRRRGGFDGDSFEPIPVIALVFTVGMFFQDELVDFVKRPYTRAATMLNAYWLERAHELVEADPTRWEEFFHEGWPEQVIPRVREASAREAAV